MSNYKTKNKICKYLKQKYFKNVLAKNNKLIKMFTNKTYCFYFKQNTRR